MKQFYKFLLFFAVLIPLSMNAATVVSSSIVSIDPAATISGTTSVCLNGVQPNITFTGSGGIAPYTFTYSVDGNPNQIIITTTGNSVNMAVPTSSLGTFTYTLISATDSVGDNILIFGSNIATITVMGNFTINAGSNTTICKGNSISLSASVSAGAPTGITYSWTGPNGFTSSLQSPTISNATSAMSGNYTVTAIKGQCHETDVVIVTVLEPTVVSANLQQYDGNQWLVSASPKLRFENRKRYKNT